MKLIRVLLSLLALGCLGAVAQSDSGSTAAPATAGASDNGYHEVHQYKIGGEGGWDYINMDGPSRRLYISRGTHMQVLNIDTGKIEGDITGLKGIHGIALDKADHKGFISDGRDNSVVVFDLKKIKQTGKVPAGTNPDAIIFDPYSKRVFAFNGRSGNATAIDAKDNKVAGTIDLGGKPEFAASDGKGKVFVNLEDKSELVQIDPKALKVVNTWPLAPGESPNGLSIDADHDVLFSGCHNEMMAIVDGNSGKVITTQKIGRGVDATAFDKGVQQAYSSNGEGNITVIKENSPTDFSEVATVPTKRGARTMSVDEKTHNLVTVTADFEPAPEPAPGQQRQRPKMVPDSFVVLVYGK
ncbi:MAG TPA: YncE family protein [Terriglobales bacterium]|nr:YncE family protein [Terriglobales bacterium]